MSFENDITEVQKLVEVYSLLEGLLDDEALSRIGRTPEDLQELMRNQVDTIAREFIGRFGNQAIKKAIDMFPSSWPETTELVNAIKFEGQNYVNKSWNKYGVVKEY